MKNIPESLLSWIIHYPGCWDTACYPTVYDALEEMSGCDEFESEGFQCTNEYCPHKALLGDENGK